MPIAAASATPCTPTAAFSGSTELIHSRGEGLVIEQHQVFGVVGDVFRRNGMARRRHRERALCYLPERPNLNNLASEVRAALGDDPQQPRFVRTAHRVGYVSCGHAEEQRTAATDDSATRLWVVCDGWVVVLEQPETIIGRDPKCTIWIDVPGVSRRHASIRLVSNGAVTAAVLEDLASTNGTFVNDRPVSSSVTLEDGQTIRVGETTLTFRASASAGAATKRIRRG